MCPFFKMSAPNERPFSNEVASNKLTFGNCNVQCVHLLLHSGHEEFLLHMGS